MQSSRQDVLDATVCDTLLILRHDLVFDVGMHRGEDTAYYLRKGYRVVGFEANPELAQECRERFAVELSDQRLVIVEGAIAPPGHSVVTFYRHPTMTIWGTTDPGWAQRNSGAGPSEAIEVPAIDFSEHLRDGAPWHLKIDIEGADRLCLEALHTITDRPATVSIEAEKVNFDALVAEINELAALGYDKFAAVQQGRMAFRRISTFDLDGRLFSYQFEDGGSGPFGSDIQTWISKQQVIARYRRIFLGYRLFGDMGLTSRWHGGRAQRQLSRLLRRPLPGWYDTHASRSN